VALPPSYVASFLFVMMRFGSSVCPLIFSFFDCDLLVYNIQ
jgi:hypothetical protein